MAKIKRPMIIMTAKAASGVGTTQPVGDFDSITLAISAYDTANLTVKVQGAIGKTKPDFAAAASETNHWDYVETINLNSGDAIAGSTGLVAGANLFRLLRINTDGYDFINCELTRTAGKCTITARGTAIGS